LEKKLSALITIALSDREQAIHAIRVWWRPNKFRKKTFVSAAIKSLGNIIGDRSVLNVGFYI